MIKQHTIQGFSSFVDVVTLILTVRDLQSFILQSSICWPWCKTSGIFNCDVTSGLLRGPMARIVCVSLSLPIVKNSSNQLNL